MKFAKKVFLIAGIYGIVVVTPLYFSEGKIGRDFPPEITHPEFLYGFAGVALAWQILFLLISRDPVRYRLMMLPGFLEKASYGIAILCLYAQQRVAPLNLFFAAIDFIFGALFLISYRKTGAAN